MKFEEMNLSQVRSIRKLALALVDELTPCQFEDENVAVEISNLGYLIAGCDRLIDELEMDADTQSAPKHLEMSAENFTEEFEF